MYYTRWRPFAAAAAATRGERSDSAVHYSTSASAYRDTGLWCRVRDERLRQQDAAHRRRHQHHAARHRRRERQMLLERLQRVGGSHWLRSRAFLACLRRCCSSPSAGAVNFRAGAAAPERAAPARSGK